MCRAHCTGSTCGAVPAVACARACSRRVAGSYFYETQEALWSQQAKLKLPALQNASGASVRTACTSEHCTNPPLVRRADMLVCGEDLGMVPACVPGVMDDLGILALRIQRWACAEPPCRQARRCFFFLLLLLCIAR